MLRSNKEKKGPEGMKAATPGSLKTLAEWLLCAIISGIAWAVFFLQYMGLDPHEHQ